MKPCCECLANERTSVDEWLRQRRGRPSTYGEDSAEDLVGEEPLGGSIPGRGAY